LLVYSSIVMTSKCEIDKNGIKRWKNDQGKLHRLDGPAIESANGDKWWYINDKQHREDGPAIDYADGSKCWFVNGKLHREDGPAIECSDGGKFWYINGKEFSHSEWLTKIRKKKLAKL